MARYRTGLSRHQVHGLGVVQTSKEEGSQPGGVETSGARLGGVVLPQGVEVVGVSFELEPAFAGQEVDEHQPVEEGLGEQLLLLFLPCLEPVDFPPGILKKPSIGLEERPGDGLHVKCLGDGFTEGLALVPVVVPHIGDLLWDSALKLVPVGHQSLELRAAARQVGADDVELVPVLVGEHQEQVIGEHVPQGFGGGGCNKSVDPVGVGVV